MNTCYRIIGATAVLVTVAACQVVPKDGPSAVNVSAAADVTVEQTAPNLSYAVVDLSYPAINAANRSTISKTPMFGGSHYLSGTSRSGREGAGASDVRIGIGDIVAITVFEAASGGLFIPQDAGSRAGNFVQTPNQQVDASGSISVPYAGTIKMAGRTTKDVADEITQKLKNRAIEPQVVISLVERRGNDISVMGEVNSPLRFSLDPGGMSVLGAIARAGGPRNPAYETLVTVQRGRETSQAVLSAIVKSPAQNIRILPGDVVFVAREPRVFMALGSTPSPGSIGGTNNRRFAFDNDNVSLTEAVSKAGGLDGARAEASAIFVFRYETRETLQAIGIDTSKYAEPLIPTIYRADWSKADGVFLANDFYMRNKDVIYVAEHPTSDFNKFTAALRGVTAAGGDVGTLAVR